ARHSKSDSLLFPVFACDVFALRLWARAARTAPWGPAIVASAHPRERFDAAPAFRSEMNWQAIQVTGTAFLVLFSIVGLALWGLFYYYDFMVQQFGWTRAQVTSGNALSKL